MGMQILLMESVDGQDNEVTRLNKAVGGRLWAVGKNAEMVIGRQSSVSPLSELISSSRIISTFSISSKKGRSP